MTVTPLLEGTGLAKSYPSKGGKGQLRVLDGVDIHVEAGESLAITGSSGSGKSTLLHLLGGLDRPDHGAIRFQGKDLSSLSSDELAKWRNAHVGFVFQFHYLLPEFTAIENVWMPALIHNKMQPSEAVKRAEHLLGLVGLADRTEHRPSELSGGEQQRVAVARALMNRPSILLADEPTGNLDDRNTEILMDLLLELQRSENLAMVLVTHDLGLTERCQRSIQLQKSNVAEDGLP